MADGNNSWSASNALSANASVGSTTNNYHISNGHIQTQQNRMQSSAKANTNAANISSNINTTIHQDLNTNLGLDNQNAHAGALSAISGQNFQPDPSLYLNSIHQELPINDVNANYANFLLHQGQSNQPYANGLIPDLGAATIQGNSATGSENKTLPVASTTLTNTTVPTTQIVTPTTTDLSSLTGLQSTLPTLPDTQTLSNIYNDATQFNNNLPNLPTANLTLGQNLAIDNNQLNCFSAMQNGLGNPFGQFNKFIYGANGFFNQMKYDPSKYRILFSHFCTPFLAFFS